MFSNLKKTIFNNQNDNSKESQISTKYSEKLINDINEKWSNSHHQSSLNSSKASLIESHIPQLLSVSNKKCKEITIFTSVLTHLPEMTVKVGEILGSISHLESLFEEIESAMYLLEDICDQMDIQENKLNHRLKLAGYREEKKMELENIQADLEDSYQNKLSHTRQRMNAEDRERCLRLEQAFLQQLDDCKNLSEKGRCSLPEKFSSFDEGQPLSDPRIKIVTIVTVVDPKTPSPSGVEGKADDLKDALGEEGEIVKMGLDGQGQPEIPPPTESSSVESKMAALDLKLDDCAGIQPTKGLLSKSGATVLLNSAEGDASPSSDAISSLPTPGALENFKSLEDEMKELTLDAPEYNMASSGTTEITGRADDYSSSSEDFTPVSPGSDDMVIL